MIKLDLEMEGYRFNQTDRVWSRPGYTGIAYSDGEREEEELYAVVEKAQDVTVFSLELDGLCSNWARSYHLSRKRANLLRPFEDYLSFKQVLEIGAGCGAISRYLGEAGASVLALEGSSRRAAIAASRCRGLDNVSVLAESFARFSVNYQFDAVVMVGVLEYARMFFPSSEGDPVDAMLKKAKKLLRPGGVLILAIENQIGLKYFSGFVEDHTGIPMFGIEDHYQDDGVVTFGKGELKRHISGLGLDSQQWWYPFPDYKHPSLIVSDRGAESYLDFDLSTVVRYACGHDQQCPDQICFNQGRAWRPVIRNGLLGDLANSFVLVASDDRLLSNSDNTLAIHYSTGRRREFTKQVVFKKAATGHVTVEQLPLYQCDTDRSTSGLKQNLISEKYFDGELLQDRLVNIVTKPQWELSQVVDWFKTWHEWFCANYLPSGFSPSVNTRIHGSYIDAIPTNIIIGSDGSMRLIDQEWEYDEEISVAFLAFRSAMVSVASVGITARPKDETCAYVFNIIDNLMKSVGYEPVDADYQCFLMTENNFKLKVLGRQAFAGLDDLKLWRLNIPEAYVETRRQNECLKDQVSYMQSELNRIDSEIDSYKKSLAEYEKGISEYEKGISEYEKGISEYEKGISEYERKISDYEKRIGEYEKR